MGTGCGRRAASITCPRNNSPTKAGISLTTVRRLERQPAAPCRSRTLGRLAAALDEDPARLTPATQP